GDLRGGAVGRYDRRPAEGRRYRDRPAYRGEISRGNAHPVLRAAPAREEADRPGGAVYVSGSGRARLRVAPAYWVAGGGWAGEGLRPWSLVGGRTLFDMISVHLYRSCRSPRASCRTAAGSDIGFDSK